MCQDHAFFSGGEQQMLAIARGIMSDPEVFIIDELSLGFGPPVVVQQLTSTLEAFERVGHDHPAGREEYVIARKIAIIVP
jgi:ABC-type branched-subunit amino acid transport system ATPase component